VELSYHDSPGDLKDFPSTFQFTCELNLCFTSWRISCTFFGELAKKAISFQLKRLSESFTLILIKEESKQKITGISRD
jgi:hypothetical protein